MDSSPIVALEIGTTKVRAMVAQARDDDHLSIIGLGECPSRGIRKSEIIDFDNALSCVRVALQSAEENANVTIRQVYMVVAGGHIQSTVNRGSLPILRETAEIMQSDMMHVMESARAVNLAADREILHTIPQQYYVDDQPGVINPAGLEGARLALDVLILHGVRSRLKNTVKIAKSVPVDVEDVAFSGLCSALAVLSPEDKENGALVIDLGGGTTSYLAYAHGTIAAAGCLAVGGDHLTNDLARGLRLALPQAESVKEEYGSAVIDLAARTQRIEIANDGGMNRRFIKQGDIQTITSLRIEEMLAMVKSQLDKGEFLHHMGHGVILTGGGAYLKRVTELTEKVFGLHCQLGKPRGVSGITLAAEGTEYASLVGLLRYAIRIALRENETKGISAMLKKMLGLG